MLRMDPEQATVMVFPLSLDMRMAKMAELTKLHMLTENQIALLAELKPLIKAMQYIRNTALHGVVMSFGDSDETYFHLRSKLRNLTREQLFSCEELINYTAHVTQAFRLSLGDMDSPGHSYALPDRPPIPKFLPPECRALPRANKEGLLDRQRA
jgi:hypothetical protein